MITSAGSGSRVSFLKQKVLHELKLRDPKLKIEPIDKKSRALYCSFTNDTINIRLGNLELKNAYIQLQLCNDTSKQCSFSFVGGETTGKYQLLARFYGLGDMPNKCEGFAAKRYFIYQLLH